MCVSYKFYKGCSVFWKGSSEILIFVLMSISSILIWYYITGGTVNSSDHNNTDTGIMLYAVRGVKSRSIKRGKGIKIALFFLHHFLQLGMRV